MKTVGIEAINIFAGTCYLDVKKLAIHRGLDTARFDNLLMKEKTVALPYEDPVTFGVNAARPSSTRCRPRSGTPSSWSSPRPSRRSTSASP